MLEEHKALAAGAPCVVVPIAGLQYYDYGTEGLDGQPLIPQAGDLLNLVRAPENPYDRNAIEVWWRNGIRLGHLPRIVAGELAEPLDAGEHVKAYVAHGGNGEPWSAEVLLVGEAVEWFQDPVEPELPKITYEDFIDDSIQF